MSEINAEHLKKALDIGILRKVQAGRSHLLSATEKARLVELQADKKATKKAKGRKPSKTKIARDAFEKYQQTLAAKVDAGKALTRSEVNELKAAANIPVSNAPKKWARTKLELADELKITRMTLDRWLKKKGAPKPKTDGRYLVEEYRAFVKPTRGPSAGSQVTPITEDEEIVQPGSLREQLLCQKASISVQEAVFDFDAKKGLWERKADIAEAIRECNQKIESELRRRLLQIAPAEYLEAEGNLATLRAINERHLEEIFSLMQSQW